MNINPSAKRILCFGDSNTYGTIPYESWSTIRRRYNASERWTWVAQQHLWNDYEIIEEWIWGRTIAISLWDDTDITKVWSLFLEYLLHIHLPIDLVVVMLWTNDIKGIYDISPETIAQHMEDKIIRIIRTFGYKLLIVSPPPIIDNLHTNFPLWSYKKVQELNNLYKELCRKNAIEYVDLQEKLTCWSDWIHLTKESHKLLWTILSKKIQEMI